MILTSIVIDSYTNDTLMMFLALKLARCILNCGLVLSTFDDALFSKRTIESIIFL